MATARDVRDAAVAADVAGFDYFSYGDTVWRASRARCRSATPSRPAIAAMPIVRAANALTCPPQTRSRADEAPGPPAITVTSSTGAVRAASVPASAPQAAIAVPGPVGGGEWIDASTNVAPAVSSSVAIAIAAAGVVALQSA